MTTFTVTIDEKSASGKHLIAKLKSAPGISIRLVKTSRQKRKVRPLTKDRALGELMRKVETDVLVSKDSTVKEPAMAYNKSKARKPKKNLMPGIRVAFKEIRKDLIGK